MFSVNLPEDFLVWFAQDCPEELQKYFIEKFREKPWNRENSRINFKNIPRKFCKKRSFRNIFLRNFRMIIWGMFQKFTS